MIESKPLVGILGLKKDEPLLRTAVETLDNFGIPSDLQVLKSKNAPHFVAGYAKHAEQRGLKVIVTTDRAETSISTVAAERTSIPTFAIPAIDIPNDYDIFASLRVARELFIISQRTVIVGGINVPGAINAALYAVAILAGSYPEINEKLNDFRAKQAQDVLNTKLP